MIMSATVGCPNFDLEVEDVFYNNMLLLNFSKSELTIKKKVVLKREMFRQPNKAGFEVAMYFLFHKLNKSKCETDFRYCWEIFDQKQASQFRRICAQLTEEIAMTNSNFDLPRNAGPIFVSPFGRKFYWLICNLSSYVLQKLGPSEEFLSSSIEEEGANLMTRSMLNKANIEMKLKNHNNWVEKFNEVISFNVNIAKEQQKEKTELKAKLLKLGKNACKPHSDETPGDTLNKLNKRWQFAYESALGQDLLNQESLSAILTKPTDVLDCRKLNFDIPDMLLERADEAGIAQDDLDQLYDEDRNINLNSVVTVCNSSLKLAIDTLRKPSVHNLSKLLVSIEEFESKEKFNLDSVRQFLGNLLQYKENLTISIQQLHHTRKFPFAPEFFQDCIVPATPPYNFKAEVNSNLQSSTPKVSPLSTYKSKADEAITWEFTPKANTVVKTTKWSPDSVPRFKIGSSKIEGFSSIDTTPLQNVLWSSRKRCSLSTVLSTPLDAQDICTKETSLFNASDFRCSTPNTQCFKIDSTILESPLIAQNNSLKSTEVNDVKFTMSKMSLSDAFSLLESTEDQSLGILSYDNTFSLNESKWLE
ncbi:HAUS augmin-like complex subunit 6 [Chamberlinius hualienensis]